MKIDPSARCPCGSKKKYRDCCKPKRDRKRLIGFIAAAALAIVIAKLAFDEEPLPPPGKVWDAEHGHYHDAPGSGGTGGNAQSPANSGAGAGGSAATQTGQPGGQAPPGKVWDAAHGHYHDAPGTGGNAQLPANMGAGGTSPPPTGQPAGQPIPQPAGPVPPGKVWSTEHGHWHDATPPANLPTQ